MSSCVKGFTKFPVSAVIWHVEGDPLECDLKLRVDLVGHQAGHQAGHLHLCFTVHFAEEGTTWTSSSS